jgi:N-acyl-D-amino-acid deacylase
MRIIYALLMKYITLLAFITLVISAHAQPYDIIIKNGKVIDGTGNSWFYADIAVTGNKIVRIERNITANATTVIDAKGLMVAPGFIDVHAHIEGGVMEKPTADNYIMDGVTTVVTGNCGSSAPSLRNFFNRLDSMHTSVNVASLIGHNTVRTAIMKQENRFATPQEQQQMEALVATAMKEGAVGLSTGLIYLPGMFSNTEEVIGLAKTAASFSGVYASHIRNEENKVLDAVEEAINIGRQANIPVQVSHFKAGYKSNWGKSAAMLQLVEQARKDGYDVTIDQYPYTASSTSLSVRVPDWAQAGGMDSLRIRAKDPAIRKTIVDDMVKELKSYGLKNYSFAVVANYAFDTTLNGKNIAEINLSKGRKKGMRNEAETILDMLDKGFAQMVYHSMSEDDVRRIMQYPYNMAAADGGVATGKGMPHPRGYGTNARVLGKYVREEKVLSLTEAIRRMTSLPAQKFHLKDIGLLREGMAADIVIFDEQTVSDRSTFEQPHQFSAGFHYVLVNGKVVVDKGIHTGIRSGRILYGPGYAQP